MYLLHRAEQSENGWIAVVEYQRTGESGFWPSAATPFLRNQRASAAALRGIGTRIGVALCYAVFIVPPPDQGEVRWGSPV